MVEDIGRAPADARFAVAFDVPGAAELGELNPAIERAAKFVNMHVAHGVPEDDIRIAIVIHNVAVFDTLTEDARSAHGLGENASAAMIRAMLGQGVRFIVCGQSAAGLGVRRDELIPGVEIALSAMTAHALLQQHGYTLNPF
ncbi:DsrE family protein [Tsuneonella sp. YG55]|uniref:DsrE family protein n=1 Tax=Tsuneonella litorea TaxID=2976475 RepID=A0A9X3AL57_9SPHN|nr:DsrE family protein [Tsuneonella litorea]MCT2559279.1 DsrE family protein [Tsuneonella litorea]